MLPELRRDLFGKNENRKFYTVSRVFTDRDEVADICSNLACDCFLEYLARVVSLDAFAYFRLL